MNSQIESAFAEAGITGLPETSYLQFAAYLALLLRWNARLNLTAIRDPEQIIRRHFVECAFAAQHLPPGIGTMLDYGSGAGFPGIPIAICRAEIRVTLAEAQGKKAVFLSEAVRTMGIASDVYDGRVEEMPEKRLFHAVSMRAVEKMEQVIPAAMQRMERYLILLTTGKAELDSKLTREIDWMEPIPLPNSEQRVLRVGKRVTFP